MQLGCYFDATQMKLRLNLNATEMQPILRCRWDANEMYLRRDFEATQMSPRCNIDVTYMGHFTQPGQKYAGTGENSNIAIPVIFYPVIKTL